jgi:hypothetical protein
VQIRATAFFPWRIGLARDASARSIPYDQNIKRQDMEKEKSVIG